MGKYLNLQPQGYESDVLWARYNYSCNLADFFKRRNPPYNTSDSISSFPAICSLVSLKLLCSYGHICTNFLRLISDANLKKKLVHVQSSVDSWPLILDSFYEMGK